MSASLGALPAFRRPAQTRFLDLGGVRLHLLDWPGGAPPVLLLHPNRTNARVWDFVVEHSRLPNRFLAPDARGHGLSSYPESGYGYDEYLDDLIALLDALQVPRVHLVGAATGGNLGLLLASRWSGRVATLTVVDPGLSLDPALSARVREQMVREFSFPSLPDAMARMPFADRWSPEMKAHYAGHSFSETVDGRVQWRYYPPGVVETEHLLETPIWDRIAVRCPVLVVRGSHSTVFTPANQERLRALLHDVRCVEVVADHRVSQDNPQALAAALDSFIASA